MKHAPRLLIPVLLTMGWLAGGALPAAGRDHGFPAPGPIADADPAEREEREIMVPDGFRAARTADILAVCTRSGPLKPIKLMVGHKMVLGMSTKFYIYPEGTERPEPLSEGWGSGTPERVSNEAGFYPAEPFGFVQRGKPYVVELEVTIFETDIPPQHMWMPQGKKYKVLWQTTLRQTPKEEREFPADIQAIKTQMERIKAQPALPDIPFEFLRTPSETWKRVLATEITAGFQNGPAAGIIEYLARESKADIALKLKHTEPAKLHPFWHGYDHAPLRAVLYDISEETGLNVDWELDEQGSPVRIVFTEKP